MGADIRRGFERRAGGRTGRATLAVALGLVSLVACLAPGGAAAALPKASNTLIVPGQSIGGAALGASPKAVSKAWGAGCLELSCSYSAPTKTGQSPALAIVGFEKTGTKVGAWEVFITIGQFIGGTNPKPDYETPLTKFKTSKGIGLGSTVSELKRAYHGAKKQINADNGITIYTLKGQKEITTNFTVGSDGRVATISILAHPGG